jgi:hypothetical protein
VEKSVPVRVRPWAPKEKKSGTGSETITTTAEVRTKLHDLVESLPSVDVPTALRILETLRSGPLSFDVYFS